MNALPIDIAQTVTDVTQTDPVQRKLSMDALRERLGDPRTKDQKLREACEGFESVFLQKMWEQMRKTVNKEGYLHSKDEETYQSLFDVELSKKMASAGGIGLADMLYQQLSQQLEHTARTTIPGSYRQPLHMDPVNGAAFGPVQDEAPLEEERLSAKDLYSPLDEEQQDGEEGDAEGEALVLQALADLKADLDEQAGPSPVGEAIRAEIRAGLYPQESAPAAGAASPEAAQAQAGGQAGGLPARDATAAQAGAANPAATQAGAASPEAAQAQAGGQAGGLPVRDATAAQAGAANTEASSRGMAAAQAGAASPEAAQAGAGEQALETALAGQAAAGEASGGFRGTSWQGLGAVSATPKPVSPFSSRGMGAAAETGETKARPRSMAPEETLWPHDGRIASGFGWEDTPGGGRQWNSGITLEGKPGDPVRAVLDGKVIFSGQREGYGNTVILEHQNGFLSYYGNIDESQVKTGDSVTRGANFATISAQPFPGHSGENSAPLFFELKRGEMALNPEAAIGRVTVAGR